MPKRTASDEYESAAIYAQKLSRSNGDSTSTEDDVDDDGDDEDNDCIVVATCPGN